MSKITETRNKTHGSFANNASVSQRLKSVIQGTNWNALTDVQKEALDMICLKISRIVSGKASVADHWIDIAGYAELARQEIED